ncbi:MAG TPA: nuclear transport factor 2 family protein [Actinomycetota bacterium]|nr:nuclear transport factor 2 family protein [Actinomycetota bacterium]
MSKFNVDLVRRGYEAFGRGDLPAIQELIAADVVWHVSGKSQIAGRFEGLEAVLGHFMTIFQLTGGTLRQEVHDIVAGDTHAVGLHRETASRGGASLDVNEVLVFHIRDNRVVEAWVSCQDQYAFDEFFK